MSSLAESAMPVANGKPLDLEQESKTMFLVDPTTLRDGSPLLTKQRQEFATTLMVLTT